MTSNKPLILITNDDGYHAAGIRKLADIVSPLADLLVVAPESARSGYACAFSATDYLRLKPRHNMGQTEVWSCSGTPVDCIKLALDRLCSNRRPDMILSGINHGDNSSVNNHYSGTVGAAKEGCMKHIPSVAFSSCYYDEGANLEPLRPFIYNIVSRVLSEGLPKGICLNVNFPARDTFEGVKVCRMTQGRWIDEITSGRHPHGYEYFWVAGKYHNDEPEATDSDQWALNHGYVAITPTHIDVTAYEFMDNLRGWQL